MKLDDQASTLGVFAAFLLRAFTLLACVSGLLAAGSLQAQDLLVYDDTLQSGFENWSWPASDPNIDFGATAQHHGGTKSISLIGNSWNAVSFAHPAPLPALTTAQYPTLHFWIHGGAVGGQHLRLLLELGGAQVKNAALDTYITGGAVAPNAWREVTVVLGNPPLSYSGSFDRIDLQSDVPGVQPVLYVDDVALLAPAAPPAANLIQIEHGVTVRSMVSDRFTWTDAAGQPRVAVLAHNDMGAGPGGTQGGELREFRYETPAGTRTVAASGGYASGFGYVVSHPGGNACVGGGDTSGLGHFIAGTFTRVFEGRHHVIFRFTQLYPRYCVTGATPPGAPLSLPVTLEWVFATGRDNPLWALTWDVSGVAVDRLMDDSRGPYGELLFDGSASEGAHSMIAGVGWGDRYKFTSTTNPVTYNSAWTWNTPNTVPYVKLWTTAVDATMGAVQTQTIVQQDAGGYWGVNRWNSTSGAGNACSAGNDGGAAHRMPCSFNWPYQTINYSMGAAIGQDDDVGTNNTRFAWGTNFGFLGQAQYPIHGSADYGGPLPNTYASGWPRKSYSTYVVFGRHTTGPVEAQVAEVETVQSLTLSATIGSVVTSGPAGVARADVVTYAPAGYNHVYGALAFNAAGNLLDANIAVGAGTLAKPLLIVGSFTGALPAVKLGGAALVQDVDYFPSLRASANELWITLNRDLVGATNHLEILASCSPIPATPVIVAPASTTAGQTGLTASVPFHAGNTYAWGITNGTITAGQTTSQITFTAGAVGSIGLSVIETNSSGCASAQAVASVAVVAGSVTVAVDPALDRRGVSPLIFGVNFGDGARLAQMHYPIRRWGGTPTSRYNWQLDVANAGNDWFFLNDVRPLPPPPTTLPDGSSADLFIDETRAAGSEPFVTVPTLGWTPPDRGDRWGFSVAAYGAQYTNECTVQPWSCNADRGDGCTLASTPTNCVPVTGNLPADTSVPVVGTGLVTGWKAHIAARTGTAGGGGVKFFGLDNEPMLWNYAHRDVHPAGTTYDEHWTKGRDVAAALKAQDAAVQVIGPNEWGWCGWFDSSADYNAPGGSCFALGPDAQAHGSMEFSAWWLAQAKAYEVAHGVRLVDYFSLHIYPQGDGIPFSAANGDTPTTQALRLRSLKELYDRSWTSESWIGDNGGKIFLIPRMRDWIAANYPGTKLAIGEYNFGDIGVSSALAQAEALAIFGREGVDMALRWTAPVPDTLVEDAFRLYMNYDGAGAKVAGESIRAVSANVDAVGSYALRDTGAHPGRIYVLLFNKTTATSSTIVNLNGVTIQGNVALWRFPDPVTGRLAAAGSVVPASASFALSLPARTATLAVLDLVQAPTAGLRLRTLTPCRVIDTRNTSGPDAGAPALSTGETRLVATTGKCGIPSTARALSVNVTVTGPEATGFLTLFSADAPSRPGTSNVSFPAGVTRANNGLLLLAADGSGFKVYNSSAGACHFILDVNGWFE